MCCSAPRRRSGRWYAIRCLGGQRHRLRDVGRPGDRARRRPVAPAAPSQPVLAQRGHRHRVRRSAPGGEGCRRVDQRRLPRRPVRCPAPLPPGERGTRRHPTDGSPGEPALRCDPAGGNRFAGVNLAAPIGVSDPEVRIKNIRSQMTGSATSVPSTWSGASPPCQPAAGHRAGVHGESNALGHELGHFLSLQHADETILG